MRKFLSGVIVALMILSMSTICSAADKALAISDIDSSSGVTIGTSIVSSWDRNDYIGYNSIDMTGIQSITVNASCVLYGGSNGESLAVKIDNPVTGTCLGYVVLCDGSKTSFGAAITQTTGTHNLYLVGSYGKSNGSNITTGTIVLSESAYTNTNGSKKISDTYVVDNYHDTWTATDDMGRKVADYEEAGPVKTDGRSVGILYWDWFANYGTENARVTSEILAQHPEAKDDYSNSVWDTSGKYYWAQPLFGFYDNNDYWVYRKHAELLGAAGVDAIFFDCSNGGLTYIKPFLVLANAFRDTKETGVNVPKISCMTALGSAADDSVRLLKTIYLTCFVEEDFSDIWYYWEGKPLLFGNSTHNDAMGAVLTGDIAEAGMLDTIDSFFTFRYNGSRTTGPTGVGCNQWTWLQHFPQHLWNVQSGGRVEFMPVGVGLNESYIFGAAVTGVFSDEYNMGRGYSAAFGEDYSEKGKRMGYFFREQSALALDVAPKFVMIDGWNEWTTIRNNVYNGFTNSFVDNFDDENSRDFEPSAGVLKDDYYNLLVDFVRKYKGVRQAPVASAKTIIDIDGATSQWDSVTPEFLNYNDNFERDSYGYKNPSTGTQYHYTTTVNNSIKSAKVARDDNNFYFYVQTQDNIVTNNDNWMQLYINIDRNKATGWNGYDFVINRETAGSLEAFVNNSWSFSAVGTVSYYVTGNVLTMEVPRSLLGETGKTDLEFKWADSIDVDGNILGFYTNGSTAPLGRFNFLYTEIQQTCLTDTEKADLTNTSILQAGNNRMIVNGGKQYVYEPDTRVTPIIINNTLYIPEEAINEIMGYGKTKVVYDSAGNLLYIKNYELKSDYTEIATYNWMYAEIGSTSARANGCALTLTNPVDVFNGIVYVPVTLLNECFGWTVVNLDNGAYAVGKTSVNTSTCQSVLDYIQ